MDKTFENKDSFEAIINNKIEASDKILDNKLLVLTHYEHKISRFDDQLQEMRKLIQGFRDDLKFDIGGLKTYYL